MGIWQQFIAHVIPLLANATLVIMMMGAIVAAVSAAAAVGQLRATKKIHDFQYQLTKRRETLGYSISRNNNYRQARLAVEKAFGVIADRDTPVTYADVQEACKTDPDIDSHVRTLLSNYENLGLAIRADVADDNVAFELLGASVLKTAEIFLPYIEHRQDERPSRYLNLIWLKKQWEGRDIRLIKYYSVYFNRPKGRRPDRGGSLASVPSGGMPLEQGRKRSSRAA
jgi:hypothetical protein